MNHQMLRESRYFKLLNPRETRCTTLIVQENVKIGNLQLLKNAVLIWDKGDLMYCEKFPKEYKGKNPFLEVWHYDWSANFWECYQERGYYPRMFWDTHCAGGRKRINIPQEYTVREYAELMKHDRRHKRGTGQREFTQAMTDYDCVHCPQMRAGHVEGYTAYMPYGDKEWQYRNA